MQSKSLGIIIIIIGVFMITIPGLNIVASEKVVDFETVKIQKEKKYPDQWIPIIGVVLLVSGIMILVHKKKAQV